MTSSTERGSLSPLMVHFREILKMAIRKVMEYLSGVIEADTKESTKMT
jgi:hypothetical protein